MTHLQDDALALEDLVLRVAVLSHIDELVNADNMSNMSGSEMEDRARNTVGAYLGARISSYLAAINMAVTPTS